MKPEARGGRSVARNIVLACRSCNRSKGARSAREWQS
ncbi:HNH endonuclease [Burkholderia multivorans]|nr:HNH endonuclease [Burkholderia multivorans]UXZ62793.1 HNH endonuclease [Burkholderia multivorans]